MADTIPEDTSTTATLAVGASVSGEIDDSYDRDWYRIELGAGTYQFDLRGEPTRGGTLQDVTLYLYDSNGTLITSDEDGGEGADSRILRDLTAGTYYLAADSLWDDVSLPDPNYETGTYTLSATLLASANGAPTAINDARSVAEDATVTGNVVAGDAFGGVADTDPDAGDVLTVTAVDGQATGVGAAVRGEYGTLTLNADGSYSYTADADTLDALPTGTTLSESFQYQISDGQGGTSTATLELTVTTVEDRITINGGNGVDRLQGGAGDEIIFGRNGADRLSGEGGADVLWGGAGDDDLLGGAGIDRLIGEAGSDRLTGGAGADTFVITKVTGTDTILDFAAEDTIEIGGFRNVDDFGDLRISTDGASTRVSFDGGAVVLANLAQPLTADDFLFG